MMSQILNLIGIGRATVVDDSGDVQLLQVTEGATGVGGQDLVTDKVPRVAEFGFASVPPLGSVVTMLRRGGERARSFVIGSSHSPSRPRDLKPGDSGIYDVRGAKVMLTADGLVIDCAGLPTVIENASSITLKAETRVRIETPIVECTGDIVSRVDGTQVSLNDLFDAYNAHKHSGVQTGTGVSGLTDHKA